MTNFSIKEENSNHKWRTEIPNIVFTLKLTPIQFVVYAALKKSAGDHGICTKSVKTIAEICQISVRKVHQTIKELCEVNPIINKSLIIKSHRFSEFGDKDTNSITIIDLWPINFEERGGSAQYAPPHAQYARPSAPDAGGVVHNMHQGGAPRAHKEEPLKNNLSEEEQTPPKSPAPKKQAYRDSVFLFPSEYEKLISEHKQEKTDKMLDILEAYKASSGKKYVSDYATMKKGGWVLKRAEEPDKPGGFQKPNRAVLGGKVVTEYDNLW